MPDITVANLGLDYGTTTVLNDISFTVADGELLTLLGPSGCGKTTTLMSIAGLTVPTRGSITCGENTLFDADRRLNRPPEKRDCGVVFQSYAIWPHMNVAGNVGYPLRLRKVHKTEIGQRVTEALELVELGHLADRYPHELSGGQQQRVALARAIVYSPQVLLLDEPLSNLDAKLREQARTWLKQIQSRLGLTTIFVTHDQDEALSMSDRIIVMNHGVIEQVGTPEQVYRNPATPFVADFLGSSNLLVGTVVESSNGLTAVRLGESGSVVHVAEPAPDAPGNQVLLMVRPEEIALSDADTAGDVNNTVPARVTSRMFLGAHYRYHVEHAGQTFHVDSEFALTSELVNLRIPRDTTRLFASQDLLDLPSHAEDDSFVTTESTSR